MEILKVRAQNLLSFDDVEIPLDEDMNILVGPNNSGKTNLARLFKLLVDDIEGNIKAQNLISFLGDTSKNFFRLEVEYKLSGEEKEDLLKFVDVCLSTRPIFTYENFERINWLSVFEEERESKIRQWQDKALKYMFHIFHGTAERFLKRLIDLISEGSVVLEARGVPHGSLNRIIEIKVKDEVVQISKSSIKLAGKEGPIRELNHLFVNYFSCFTPPDFQNLKSFVDSIEESGVSAININPDDFLYTILRDGNLLEVPALNYSAIPEEDRPTISKILLKYGIRPEPETVYLLTLLIYRLFASKLVIMDEIRERPKQRSLEEMESLTSDIYKGTGADLSLSLFNLKNSDSVEARNNYDKIKELFKDITDGLDFEATYEGEEVNVRVIRENRQFPIEYVGSGILEILNILQVSVGNNGCTVLLDEPASHLHPSKQCELLEQVKAHARSNNNQLIIITHSPYLVNSRELDRVLRFSIKEGCTKVVKASAIQIEGRDRRIFDNPEVKSGLFSDGVVLAEGVGEAHSVPNFLSKLGLDFESENITTINVGSDNRFRPFVNIFSTLEIPYVAVCDLKALTQKKRGWLPKLFNKEGKKRIEEIIDNEETEEKKNELIEIAKKYNVFAYPYNDFNEFLKTKFGDRYEEIRKERGLRPNKKADIAITVSQEATVNEIKDTEELSSLKDFIEERIL